MESIFRFTLNKICLVLTSDVAIKTNDTTMQMRYKDLEIKS